MRPPAHLKETPRERTCPKQSPEQGPEHGLPELQPQHCPRPVRRRTGLAVAVVRVEVPAHRRTRAAASRPANCSERNRAYFRAYQTLVFVLLLAYIVAEVLEKALGWVPTRGVVANFLTLLIFAALTLPAAILAWWDAGDEG